MRGRIHSTTVSIDFDDGGEDEFVVEKGNVVVGMTASGSIVNVAFACLFW